MNLAEAVTVGTPIWNAADALALMWESFRKHHGEVSWLVADDGSTDGAADYAKTHASRYWLGEDRTFGRRLDELVRATGTPYLLLTDSDVEFLGPVVVELLKLLEADEQAWAVGGPWNVYHAPEYHRVDISCALVRISMVREIQEWFSFAPCRIYSGGDYYLDTGGQVWRAARLRGWSALETGLVREQVLHVGGLSALWDEAQPEGRQQERRLAYKYLQERLRRLRAGDQRRDDLQWVPTWGWRYREDVWTTASG